MNVVISFQRTDRYNILQKIDAMNKLVSFALLLNVLTSDSIKQSFTKNDGHVFVTNLIFFARFKGIQAGQEVQSVQWSCAESGGNIGCQHL